MTEPQGVNSAMLASMEQAGNNNMNTGSATATSDAIGGNIDNHLLKSNISSITSSLGGVSLPINSAPLSENVFKHGFEGNSSIFNLPGEILPPAQLTGNTGADNLGFAKQTNANMPRLHSGTGGGEQQQ